MKHLMKRAWTKYALVALVTALVVAPAVAVASHGFTDVPNSNIFHNNIQWMKDNGVTLGCNPPANDRYCPNNTVNRGQMAAFMQRLAENKVVDAATAVTAETATLATTATNATNATNAANAANADKLDGLDSTAFLVADTITTSYDGGMWIAHSFNAATLDRFIHQTQLSSGNGAVILDLAAPNDIAGVSYGIESIDVCATGGGSITDIQLWQTSGVSGSGVWSASDTPRAPGNCVTYAIGLGGNGTSSALYVATTGSVNMFSTSVTWSTGAATASKTSAGDQSAGGN